MHVLWAQNTISKSDGGGRNYQHKLKVRVPQGGGYNLQGDSFSGREESLNRRLFCNVYCVNMDQEIITRIKKKNHPSFYSLALWCVIVGWPGGLCVLQLAWDLPSLVWRRKTPTGGPGFGWMTKTTAGSPMSPVPPAINKIANGVYLNLAQGNTLWTKISCSGTHSLSPQPLPLAYFSLGKGKRILNSLSLCHPPHTHTHSLDHPPSPEWTGAHGMCRLLFSTRSEGVWCFKFFNSIFSRCLWAHCSFFLEFKVFCKTLSSSNLTALNIAFKSYTVANTFWT